MRILAIETSCDETAIAIADFRRTAKKLRGKKLILTSAHDRGDKLILNVNVLSNIVSSQVKLHAKFGGVVPSLAKREHQRNLPLILLGGLKKAAPNYKIQITNYKQISNSKLKALNKILEREPDLLKRFIKYVLPLKTPKTDAIAVTYGPGLEPALWVGINFAKALSYIWGLPIIPVDHMKGHLFSALLQKPRNSKFQNPNSKRIQNPKFQIIKPNPPALALLVSGGHTELVLMRGWNKFKIIGETLDDAAGEAFDKVARLLGLGYPGGPAISAMVEKLQIAKSKLQNPNYKQSPNYKTTVKLPRPMINSGDFSFSFSGLKTAVLYLVRDLGPEQTKRLRPQIADEFQNAVVEVLVSKTIRAAKKYKAKTILLGGGVAANKLLQTKLAEEIKKQIPNTKYLIPNTNLTGDNALMVAAAAYFNQKKTARSASWRIRAVGNLRLY